LSEKITQNQNILYNQIFIKNKYSFKMYTCPNRDKIKKG
jgi:hypothetical protein